MPLNETPSNDETSNLIPVEYLGAVAVAITVVLFALFLLVRRRGYDVEKIFKEHPQLSTEEKDVIQFLAEKDGKAFESQIREKFPDIPQTSLWRLVKRLETLELIKVKKIGIETQVELKKVTEKGWGLLPASGAHLSGTAAASSITTAVLSIATTANFLPRTITCCLLSMVCSILTQFIC